MLNNSVPPYLMDLCLQLTSGRTSYELGLIFFFTKSPSIHLLMLVMPPKKQLNISSSIVIDMLLLELYCSSPLLTYLVQNGWKLLIQLSLSGFWKAYQIYLLISMSHCLAVFTHIYLKPMTLLHPLFRNFFIHLLWCVVVVVCSRCSLIVHMCAILVSA